MRRNLDLKLRLVRFNKNDSQETIQKKSNHNEFVRIYRMSVSGYIWFKALHQNDGKYRRWSNKLREIREYVDKNKCDYTDLIEW